MPCNAGHFLFAKVIFIKNWGELLFGTQSLVIKTENVGQPFLKGAGLGRANKKFPL